MNDNLNQPLAEQVLLGDLLLDNNLIDAVSGIISQHDFTVPVYSKIFELMLSFRARRIPIDVVLLRSEIKFLRAEDLTGGEGFIQELVKNSYVTGNTLHYASVIKDASTRRSIIAACSRLGLKAALEGDVSGMLDECEQQIMLLSSKLNRSKHVSMSAALVKAVEGIENSFENKGVTGLLTGFTKFDEIVGGIAPGTLHVIAAKTSMGKTVFAMNIVQHMAMTQDVRCLVFSFEMPPASLAMRFLASIGGVDYRRVKSGEFLSGDNDSEVARFSYAVSVADKFKLDFLGSEYSEILQLKSYVVEYKKQYPDLGVVVVDHLHLMTSNKHSTNKTIEISDITKKLKILALDLGIPIILLSQLNRNQKAESNARPTLSELRDSGSIEQDADTVTFIHREDFHKPPSQQNGLADLFVVKNRENAPEDMKLIFEGRYCRFRNIQAGNHND